MSVKAVAKNVSISPRKVGVVAGLVRGRTVADAIVILNHTPRHASVAVRKAVESARANAENNHNYKAESLIITHISVTPGRRLKRFRPAAHGRALPFQRKSSHITVHVDGEVRAPKKDAKVAEISSAVSAKTENAKTAVKKTEVKKVATKKPAAKKTSVKKESK